MRVLAVDTAGPVVGLAARGAGGPVGTWEERVVRGADARLAPAAAELLGVAGALDLVAVAAGPGAFTGLRVGLALALGIALARGVPVAPVSSLAARAALAAGAPRVLALLDARRGRVYGGWFDASAPGLPRALGPERDAPLDALLDGAAPGFVAVGEGAEVHAATIEAAGGRVLPDAARSPAPELARLAAAGELVRLPPERVRLRYIREADARRPGGAR